MKIVIIVILVLILVLFVCGMGLGIRGNSQPAGNVKDLQGSWLGGLRQSLVPAQTLKIQDVEKGAPLGCIQSGGFVAQRGQACQLTVQTSFWPVRKQLALRLSQGAKVEIRLTPKIKPDEDGMSIIQELTPLHPEITPDEQQKLEVYRDGGTLVILCVDSQTAACRLDIR